VHKIYNELKETLKEVAKISDKSDKPRFNMELNNTLDYLIKGDLQTAYLRDEISENQFNSYSNKLANFVCKLHI